MRYRILAALLGLVLCGSGVALAAGSYTQVFDVAPATPQPVRPLTDWDVTVHSDNLDPATWLTVAGRPMDASHGPDCGAPPATHRVATYDDTVFFCKNHVMTAISGDGGYAALYLTPPQMLDWSADEAVLRWDMSTLRTSARDWMDVWITPYADALQAPLDAGLPDLQGPPRRAVHLTMDNGPGGTMFRTRVVRDFTPTEVSTNNWSGYEGVLVPDAARRDTFELHIARTHLTFGLPAYNLWWMDGDIPDLGWDQGVVQFGHHSYNPMKECGAPPAPCAPNTWHWDNVTLSSAVPFTIGKVSPRAVSDQGNPPLVFDAPASAAAVLHFMAYSSVVQTSWDNGATWANAPTAPESKHDTSHFELYAVPVPEGATSVQVQASGAWWQARDFSVWSQIGVPRTRTPTPAPNTPTATPVPPTATVTPPPTTTVGPTSTPMPSPTLLPTSTPAPDPTATPIPGPLCELVSIINGVLVNTPLPSTSCPQ